MKQWAIAGSAFLVAALLSSYLLWDDADALPPAAEEDPELVGLTFERARAEGVPRPEWRVGDAWRVKVHGGPEWVAEDGGAAQSCTLGIVTADASGYRLGASCGSLAARLVLDPNVPLATLGPDLDARRDEASVAFFQWPLQAGRTWPATWGDQELSVMAKYEPAVEGPLGKEPGFRLEMVDEAGILFATYTYAPSLRWWSGIELANGFRLEILGYAPGEESTLFTAAAEEALSARYTTGAGNPLRSFDVGPDISLLYIEHVMVGPNAQYIRVDSPAGRNAYDCLCSTGATFGPPVGPDVDVTGSWHRARIVEAEAGTWSVTTPRAGTGTMTFTVHAVQLFEHTL